MLDIKLKNLRKYLNKKDKKIDRWALTSLVSFAGTVIVHHNTGLLEHLCHDSYP